MDDPKIENHDRCNRAQEDSISSHKIQEVACAGQDLPWHQGPTENRAEQLSAADVYILGKESCEVIGCGEGVRGDVDTKGREGEREGCEESSCAIGPVCDESHWIPLEFTVFNSTGARGRNSDEGDK